MSERPVKVWKAALLNKKPRAPIYMDWKYRCQYAVETMRSAHAPVWEQVTELELLLLDEDDR
jgi:hypothetical protein